MIIRAATFEEKSKEKILEFEQLIKELINNANDGIYIREAESRKIIFANRKFSEIHGIPLDKIIAMDSRDLLSEKERERLKDLTPEKYPKRIELKVKGRNGREIFVEETVVLVKNERGEPQYVFGIVRDVIKKKRLEAKLKKMATKDALTGVFNRHFFNEFVYKEWERNKRFTLILVDVDNFKSINDNF